MTAMLNTLDQVPGIGTLEGPQLTFEAREVSAREIVRARVAAEVERYNNADDPPHLVGASGDARSIPSARSKSRSKRCAKSA